MRYFEIAYGFRLPVSCEEQELLDLAKADPIAQDELDERSQELARLMTSRGLFKPSAKDGRVFYQPNSANDIWRDRDG